MKSVMDQFIAELIPSKGVHVCKSVTGIQLDGISLVEVIKSSSLHPGAQLVVRYSGGYYVNNSDKVLGGVLLVEDKDILGLMENDS